MITAWLIGVVAFAIIGATIIASTQDIKDGTDCTLWALIVVGCAFIWPVSISVAAIGALIWKVARRA